ncbi:MAG TPA: hypothetical protein VH877_09025 [Polyangia bacterium]|jgi:hypothetical protein|nr:hypothetical protein [Polyangia bacterium]
MDRFKVNRLVGESLKTMERGTLHLAAQSLNDEELAAILADKRVPALNTLNVQDNPLSRAAIQTMSGSSKLQGLQRLALSDCAIGDEGMTLLAQSPILRSVYFLLLAGVNASSKGVEALAASPHTGALRRLDLSGQSLGDVGASAVLRLHGLEDLTLQKIDLQGAGARTLIEGATVKVLDLDRNSLGPGALVGLRRISPSLGTITLKLTGLGPQDAAALAALPANLQVLDLSYCPIGDAGVRALARAPWIGQLQALDAIGSQASEPAKEALRQAYGARRGLTL